MIRTEDRMITIMKYVFVTILALVMALPLVLVVVASFTPETVLRQDGFSLIPRRMSLDAYRFLLSDFERILTAYRITITATVLGSFIGITATVLIAYVCSKRFLPGHRWLNLFVLLPMVLNGGMVAWYIVNVRYLGMRNNIWALTLPIAVLPFNVILMRSFFHTLPETFRESALIDGANEWRIFFSVILPLSLPGLATVGMFIALTYWNDWYLSLMLITDRGYYTLQFLLREIISNIQAALTDETGLMATDLPTEAVKMATAVISIGPILFVYPFVQRYFIKGITLGGVKG